MTNITDMIKQEIRSFERDRDTAAKEAEKKYFKEWRYMIGGAE